MEALLVAVLQIRGQGRLVGEIRSFGMMNFPLAVMVLAGVFFAVERYDESFGNRKQE
ncbi:hypothetical protein D3C87_1774430 [compost metagenome]